MKLTIAIVVFGMAWGTALAQNPDLIQNTHDTMKALQQKQAHDSNAVLNSMQGPAQKPAPSQAGPVHKALPHAAPAPKVAVKNAEARPKAHAAVARRQRAPKEKVSVENKASATQEEASASNKPIGAEGRRDPFLSPVVNQVLAGSGCSVGKRCLAVDQIVLKGVVRADTGMIAVVVNSLDKAYFLRENDPVFNGYVVKITGDSVIFRETVHDKLGKPFTRDITKKITTPAV
ncbi:MAG TPA: hypothetical protein VMH85_05610 [Terriglobales bacterium]|nr:hypothetical protein [Terriglobales bacterium]